MRATTIPRLTAALGPTLQPTTSLTHWKLRPRPVSLEAGGMPSMDDSSAHPEDGGSTPVRRDREVSRTLAGISMAGRQIVSGPRWLLRRIVFEARVTYCIVWRDLSASLIPATLFSLTALNATAGLTVGSVAQTLLRSLLYFSLYIYAFCLSNQLVGHEEDRVNKPDRVLPAGLIDHRGAVLRWALAMVMFPLMGLLLGGWPILLWALVWQAIFLSYNFLGLHRHWLTKNVVFISLGTIALLAPAWQLVAPIDAVAWRWIIVVAVAFGLTLHLQDLRDVQGDRIVGRRTLSMVIGQDWARWLLAVGIGSLPVVTHVGLIHGIPLSPTVVIIEVLLATLNMVVAVRTVKCRSPQADHRTYILHTYWFCAVLASGILLL